MTKIARITNDNKLLIKGTLTEMQKINEIELVNGENLLPVVNGYTLDTETGIYTVYGTKGSFRIPYPTFDDGKRYLLSFKIKKTSGDILSVAGHSASFYDFEVYLDGELIGTRWSTGLANTYPNNNLEHEYKVVLTFDSSIIDHLYIQPNRTNGYTTDFTAEVWDLKLEEINEYIDNISLDANGNLKLPNDVVELGDGYYLNMPTTSGRVTTPYDSGLAVTTEMSACFWVNLPSIDSWKFLFSQSTAWNSSWTFWSSAGRPTLTINGTHYTGNYGLTENEWRHMAVSYDNGTIKYYLDGILNKTITGANTITPSTLDFSFNSNSYPMTGSIKDVRFYSRPLSQAEFQSIMNNPNYSTNDELIWQPLNEGSGTTATDISGNGRNGAISNGEWESEPVNIKLKDGVLYVNEIIEGVDLNIDYYNILEELVLEVLNPTSPEPYIIVPKEFMWTKEPDHFGVIASIEEGKIVIGRTLALRNVDLIATREIGNATIRRRFNITTAGGGYRPIIDHSSGVEYV